MKSTITPQYHFSMQRIFSLAILMIMVLSVSAQDVIHLKDTTEIQSKVIEISDERISYRLFGEPDDSIYSIPKSSVALIVYENGTMDDFEEDKIVLEESDLDNQNPATVVFIITGNLKLEYFDNDKYIGETKKACYFKYTCPPGKHLLWISYYNKEFLTADLEPGGTYLVNVVFQSGFTRWDGKISTRPYVLPTKPKHYDRFIKDISNEKRWATNSEEDIVKGSVKLKEFIEERLVEYETDWKFTEDFSHISPELALTDPKILSIIHKD